LSPAAVNTTDCTSGASLAGSASWNVPSRRPSASTARNGAISSFIARMLSSG
jgi:hypothetical protein